MSAYLFAYINAHNLDWVSEYMKNVPRIVKKHGGRYEAIAKNLPSAVELVEGSAPAPRGVTIIKFPSMDAIKNFLKDPMYAPYKRSRVEGTESNLWAFENDATAPQFIEQ